MLQFRPNFLKWLSGINMKDAQKYIKYVFNQCIQFFLLNMTKSGLILLRRHYNNNNNNNTYDNITEKHKNNNKILMFKLKCKRQHATTLSLRPTHLTNFVKNGRFCYLSTPNCYEKTLLIRWTHSREYWLGNRDEKGWYKKEGRQGGIKQNFKMEETTKTTITVTFRSAPYTNDKKQRLSFLWSTASMAPTETVRRCRQTLTK